MKVLLDECVVQDFRHLLLGHHVYTVAYMGWSRISNGQLLALAASQGFDVLVTVDAGIPHQQNLAALPIGVVVLHAVSNDIDVLARLVPNLLATLRMMSPRTLHHVHA